MTPAADRWAADLRSWAIPDELLAAVDESPYGWPQEFWKRRSELARVEDEPVTTGIVRGLLGPEGVLADVGAGRGRASLPLAREGHRLVCVEKDPAMAAGLREDSAGLEVEVVEESWPAASSQMSDVDVVMSAHVVYDVQDIGPFLLAMHRRARSGVVLEVTESHPWSSMAPYYRALHGLERPTGPTATDLTHVIREVLGVDSNIEWWERGGQLWFADWDEIEAFYGRRLVLPLHRRAELRPLLATHVEERAGRLYVGGEARRLATIWWTSDL